MSAPFSYPQLLGSGLLAELERPQHRGKFPAGYHEAYWFYGFDEQSHVGYYFYLLADTESETLRHEQIYLYLPDGSVLAGFGSGENSRSGVAAGRNLSFKCEQPFRHWEIAYDAETEHLLKAQLLRGNGGTTKAVPAQVRLSFEARTPAWNTEGDWGEPPPGLRYHQLGHCTGAIRWADQQLSVSGPCFRSHSRRSRDLSGWTGHTLANGLFPSGAAFGLFRMEATADRPERGRGFVYRDNVLYDADVLYHPRFRFPDGKGETFVIELTGEFGSERIEGETLAEAHLTQGPWGRAYGIHTQKGPGMVLSDGFARYRWRGESTVGVLERSTLVASIESANIG